MSAVNLLFLIIIMLISKVSIISFIKNLKSLIFLVIFLMAVYIFIPNSGYTHIMYDFKNGYALYWDSLYQSGYIILRLIMMLLITMILTSTTKPLDLTYALEWFMHPLKFIGFPIHAIAMTISIALRFIPTLLDEVDRIMKAQASRGVDFNKGGLIKKFKAVISLIIPLLISSFKRSEELSNAMEARGYDPDKKRSRYRTLSFTYRDLIALLIVLIYFAGILTLCILNYNGYEINIIKFIFNVEPIF
jgi:energy-coupling factor transport system permease protein